MNSIMVLSTKVSGLKKALGVDVVNRFGKMVLNMKVTGKMTWLMGEVD